MNNLFFWLLSKLVLLFNVLSDYIIKIIAIYHLYYKKKIYINNLTQKFAYNTKLSLITKKKTAKNFYIFFLFFLIFISLILLYIFKNALNNI